MYKWFVILYAIPNLAMMLVASITIRRTPKRIQIESSGICYIFSDRRKIYTTWNDLRYIKGPDDPFLWVVWEFCILDHKNHSIALGDIAADAAISNYRQYMDMDPPRNDREFLQRYEEASVQMQMKDKIIKVERTVRKKLLVVTMSITSLFILLMVGPTLMNGATDYYLVGIAIMVPFSIILAVILGWSISEGELRDQLR